MNSLKVIFLCIALFANPSYTEFFPDAPPEYVTEDCRKTATKFVVQSVPLGFKSALFCMYQNLQVLENLKSLDLALTTPHTGRSICRIEVHWFNETAKRVNMTIYDTDLLGNCTKVSHNISKRKSSTSFYGLQDMFNFCYMVPSPNGEILRAFRFS
uniref:Putative secreted protein n=1 Tax=Ixodes ricinus TaxID=34613 RepID=A0A6B0UVZ2_IXORI